MDEWDRGAFDDFVLLAHVVDHGGFSAAARAIGLSQATISRRIAELERRAGLRLLHRTSRKIALTDAGLRLVEHGRAFAREMQRTRVSIADLSEPRGTVRLTAPTILGYTLLGPIIAEFGQLCPDVLVVLDLDGARADLISENFDIAIRVGSLPSSSLIASKIGIGIAALYATKAYLDAHGEPKALSDLAKHRLLYCLSTTRTHAHAEWRMQHRDGTVECLAIIPSVVSNQPRMLCELATQSAGIARLPLFTTTELERNGVLKRVLPDWEGEHLEMHLVTPAREGMGPASLLLKDLLRKRLRPHFR